MAVQKNRLALTFTEAQIQSLAPNPAAFSAGKKLSAKEQWQSFAQNDRAIWGSIKGSGSNPYLTQIDITALAYKCTCPSRQFPCKHGIGLMLLYINHAALFKNEQEPEWVAAWMDKRVAKEKAKPAEKERTEEEQEQLEKNRGKTQQNRLASVIAGAEELELWLKDLVRIGLLELPNKTQSDFDRMAARMVDAKAPGLGGWVKTLGRLNYEEEAEWQHETLAILSKLFLLVRAIRNHDTLSPLWQQTIKNLSGWSQSAKELLADADAETLKDQWLVAGQEVEVTDDDITIQRNWLLGCTSNRQALVLNFGTKFTAIESTILPGTVIEGEFAFFPSIWPQRGAFKIQRRVKNDLDTQPAAFGSWQHIHTYRVEQLKIYPWLNDVVVILKDARLIKDSRHWIVCDTNKLYMPIVSSYDFSKILTWLAISGNRPTDMALAIRNNHVLPLGVFDNSNYKVL